MCLNAGGMGRCDAETETLIPTIGCGFDEVAHTLKAEGFDASEDGTGRGTPLVPVAFSYKDSGNDATVELSPTLRALGAYDANGGGQMAVAVSLRGREGGGTAELGDEVQNCLRASSGGGDKPHVLAPVVPLQEVGKRTGVSTDDPRAGIGIGHDGDPMFTLQAGAQHGVGLAMAVRRLTPVECERLQGFPDGWTMIPWPAVTELGEKQCAKRVIRATVRTPGGRFFVATNHVRAVPETGCPRLKLKTGEGWHLCKEVCGQKGHAEINALRIAGKHARGATLYVEGHDYVCDGCRAAAEKAGIAAIVIGPADATSCPDGPRYKALGNSMAVPCMRWIGQRIAAEIATAAKTNSEEKAA